MRVPTLVRKHLHWNIGTDPGVMPENPGKLTWISTWIFLHNLGSRSQWVNSLMPSDAIWRHRSGSTLAQLMACCLMAPSHYLTNVDLSLVRSSGIHLRAISSEIPQPSLTKINLKIIYLKLNWNLPGLNELITQNGVKLPPHPGTRWYGTYQPPSDGLRGNQSMMTTELEPAHVLYQCSDSMHTGSLSLTHWPLEDFKDILYE